MWKTGDQTVFMPVGRSELVNELPDQASDQRIGRNLGDKFMENYAIMPLSRGVASRT
jgi:hypothetical protein